MHNNHRESAMNRSEVNDILRRSAAFIGSFGYVMPPFADWEPERMRRAPQEAPDIISRRLGWDVTDFGEGQFADFGLFLFTVRNGDAAQLARGRGMLYAEKIMISRDGQRAPMHRHNIKAEDIINRGGGDLVLELFAPAPGGGIDPDAAVTVPCDGVPRTLPAGGHLRLKPGESVTLLPGIWHAFWGERADVLIGEVSTVNDDLTDNVFRDSIGRFADIVEDEEPWRLLVSDYGSLAAQRS
jgi:D-lyxose ketol-isomerase